MTFYGIFKVTPGIEWIWERVPSIDFIEFEFKNGVTSSCDWEESLWYDGLYEIDEETKDLIDAPGEIAFECKGVCVSDDAMESTISSFVGAKVSHIQYAILDDSMDWRAELLELMVTDGDTELEFSEEQLNKEHVTFYVETE